MASPSAWYSWSSPTVRRILERQQLIVVIAIALFALLKVTDWEGAEFGPIVIYTFVSGNLVWPAMNRLAPFSDRFRSPYNWIVFVSILFLVALVSSTIALLVTLGVYRAPLAVFREQFWTGGRLGVVVVLIVGCIIHFYNQTRAMLERRNRELQRTVEDGKSQSQAQEQELGKAREIQEGLLPKNIPQVRGLEIAGVWHPARTIGGDFYDVVKFSDRRVGVCIGDVVGKGISAALLMANLQASFRAFTSQAISPAGVVGKMNEVLCNNLARDKFVTFCYCTIDLHERRLTYAGAGHMPPILVRKSGAPIILREGGRPLGIFPDGEYEDISLDLQSGDQIVFYTDGLTEATNSGGEEFGETRTVELGGRNVRLGADALLNQYVREVTQFCAGNFQDDLTMVVVSVK
jgi:sigma-B regulation protein RsbU (phosphoserine phosphatase)